MLFLQTIRKQFAMFSGLKLCGISLPRITAIFIVFGALVLRFFFIWASLRNLPVTSDEASVFLQAKMIHDGARPLLCLGQPYLFPIEAYMMAPFVDWLPRTALGARYQSILLGLGSLVGFITVIRMEYSCGNRWPAILLVLFPSAYFLILTSAYSPFQYPMAMILVLLGLYLVFNYRDSQKFWAPIFMAGMVCGLAWSTHLFTATVTVGLLLALLFCGDVRRGFRITAIFCIGLIVGAVPYALAIYLEPNAYLNVPHQMQFSQLFSVSQFVSSIWGLSGAFGLFPVFFPDLAARSGWFQASVVVGVGLYFLLLVGLICDRSKVFLQASLACRWPKLTLVDAALCSSVLIICWYVSHITIVSYRYFLPAIWCFPFIFGYLYATSKGYWKGIIAGLAVCIVALNIAQSAIVLKEWQNKLLIQKDAGAPEIDKLINQLEARNVKHCYASFWLNYRITFQSEGKIICSMPFNERFIRWPVPFKEEVDKDEQAVYVLSMLFGTRFPPTEFQKQLRKVGIEYKSVKVPTLLGGSFIIYSDFSEQNNTRKMTEHDFLVNQMGFADQTDSPIDNSIIKASHSAPQHNFLWLEVAWRELQTIKAVSLSPLPILFDSKNQMKVQVKEHLDDGEKWRTLSIGDDYVVDSLSFDNSHPIFNVELRNIRLISQKIKAVRVGIDGDVLGGRPLPKLAIMAEME